MTSVGKIISILLYCVPMFGPQALELEAFLKIAMQPSHFTEEKANPERGLSMVSPLGGGRGGPRTSVF